ncbi:MAG: DUF2785 domain-containing protein [Anaerolineaceae bacterium]|nr:DUF2785 domain-containing protein [Anaerolineaceae bacterium]
MELNLKHVLWMKEHDYNIPDGMLAEDVTRQLIDNLGALDSDLRENSYSVLGHRVWGQGDHSLTHVQLLEMGNLLAQNLRKRDEEDRNGVFRRAFSALILAEISGVDIEQDFINPAQYNQWLQTAIDCFLAEKDLRGFDPEYGWAHLAAHMADFFYVAALQPKSTPEQLMRIMDAIADKLCQPVAQTYLHEEDERLCRAVITALKSGKLNLVYLAVWLKAFEQRANGDSWMSMMQDSTLAHTRHNLICFLRALYLQMCWRKQDRIIEDENIWSGFLAMLEQALKNINIQVYTSGI